MDELYNRMWNNALVHYQKDAFEYDNYLTGVSDNRRGITLLARPNQEVASHINYFLSEFSRFEPEQYLYPTTDFHMTVMSIISCRAGYQLDSRQKRQYVKTVRHLVEEIAPFEIELKGVTATPNCILVKGYVNDPTLQDLRSAIRNEFNVNSLETSIDSRYEVKASHLTIIRFRRPIKDKHRLINFLEKNKERYFGKVLIRSLELVFNDWYQTKRNTKLLARIELGNDKVQPVHC